MHRQENLCPPHTGIARHNASVYDPAGRIACHYVDGEQVSCEEIPARMFINQLRIGNAEIGNGATSDELSPSLDFSKVARKVGLGFVCVEMVVMCRLIQTKISQLSSPTCLLR
jgi:hypothetical protein